jgi:hypothetical protein
MKTMGMVDFQHLLDVLKNARQRKEMYFQPVTVEAAENFLGGFSVACLACGVITHGDLEHAQKTPGWKENSMGPLAEMRERSLTEEQIIDELIELEITAIQRAASRS